MKKLNPELFTYELWESSYWTRLGFSYDADAFQVARKASECAVGYCDAYVFERKDLDMYLGKIALESWHQERKFAEAKEFLKSYVAEGNDEKK